MPQRLARYQIEDLLGEGTFAFVYRAFDERLRRRVALKVLKPFWLNDPKAVENFKHEAHIMARLHHPNIVIVHDVGEAEGSVYLAQFLVEGETLAARLERGPLSWADTLAILQPVAAALDYAHGQGVVHRDVKPANILLATAGQVYLGDFGLVQAAEGSASVSASTGGMVGTPFYMAPEQWREELGVTGAADVYALSCLVVEMLTGQVLFGASTRDTVMVKHLIDGPAWPEQWPSDVPANVETVLKRGLQRDQAERFGTAGELVAALTDLSVVPVKTKETPRAEPAPVLSEPTRGLGDALTTALGNVRRASSGLWAGGALILLIVAAIIFFTVRGGGDGGPTPGTEPAGQPVAAGDNPTSTPTGTPTSTPVPPTDTPQPPTPTNTPVPPTGTPANTPIPPTETPTNTPESTSTPTDIPSPTQTSTNIPSPTRTSTPLPPQLISSTTVNVRFGPGTNYPVVGSLQPDSPLEVIGRNEAGTWWQVQYTDDTVGWVAGSVSEASGVDEIAVVQAPPTPIPSAPVGMVPVPAGPFEMGSESGDSDEQSVHTVSLDAFFIDQYEVTNAEFATFLNEQGNQTEWGASWLDAGDEDARIHQKGDEWQADEDFTNHPVVEVSWYGAKAYCEWRDARLPTEAEWEKVARGTEGQTYPWGEGLDCDKANYSGCVGGTTEVGSYPAGVSPYGAYDMAGNVWEWVQSEKRDYPYEADDGRENLDGTNVRVLRGGSWGDAEVNLRAASRGLAPPVSQSFLIGFRCVVEAAAPG